MARKSAEEAGLDAAAAEAERQTREAAASAQAHAQQIAAQQQGAQGQVLSSGPIPEVKLGPAAGAPPINGDAVDPDLAARFLLDPSSTAPVIGDATKRAPYKRAGSEQRLECSKCGVSCFGKFCQECGSPSQPAKDPPPGAPSAAKEEKWFAVLETKMVLDTTNGHRTPLRAGKVISSKHYDIAKLLRQGAKLKKVDSPTAATTDEALIAALTA
jgi:hypothetical protein